MTSRPSDDKIYSLIPMYVETFGEDIIIKRLENLNPKLVVISNYNTYNYYFKEFGVDYAIEIAKYLNNSDRHQFDIIENNRMEFNIFVKK